MQKISFVSRRQSTLNDQLTLSSHVAATVITRSIRSLLKYSQRFVSALVVSDFANYDAYRVASHAVLNMRLSQDFEASCRFDVISIESQGDMMQLTKLSNYERVIILLKSADLLTGDVIAASDVVVHLPQPTAKEFMIGARRMGFGRLKQADAKFLATQDLGRVSLAFRSGRATDAIMNTLRGLPSVDNESPLAKDKHGPTLDQLSGYGEASTWGLELAQDLVQWKAGSLSWRDVDRGVLIFGPPGSGKTQFASSLARTCGVELVATSAGQWQSYGHLGDMLKAMRKSFELARKKSPSILFIDELDSVGTRKSGDAENDSYERQVVNALLECVDGTQGLEGVVVIGATNFPQVIDPALLRPGRLEKHFEIELPDSNARIGILKHHLGEDLVGSDLEVVVLNTVGWSGADIAKLVRDARRVARRGKREMELGDLVISLPEKVPIPSDYLEMTAVHEAGHAIVGVLVEADELISVSIAETVEKGSKAQPIGGAQFHEGMFARKTSTYFDDKIAVLLAGMAAEKVVFSEHTVGSGGYRESDLVRATELATMMEVKWGFGASISSEVSKGSEDLDRLRGMKPKLARHVEARLKKQYARAENMLVDRIEVLREIAAVLLRSKTMTGAEVRRLVTEQRLTNERTQSQVRIGVMI